MSRLISSLSVTILIFNAENSCVRGDVVEIFPASRDENAFRVEFFGDEIDRICEIESLTGRNLGEVEHLVLFPATHFMTNEEHMEEGYQEYYGRDGGSG